MHKDESTISALVEITTRGWGAGEGVPGGGAGRFDGDGNFLYMT